MAFFRDPKNRKVFNDLLAGDILPRLPAKSALRFKSVSKRWRSYIGSPAFAALHLRHSRGRPCLLLRHNPDPNSSGDGLIVLIGDGDGDISEIAFPSTILTVPAKPGFSKIVGSCNGIVCVAAKELNPQIAFWNPATSAFRALPAVHIPRSRGLFKSSLGFGYQTPQDYKVFLILFYEYQGALVRSEAQLYSSKTDSWTKVSFQVTQNHNSWITRNFAGVFAKTALHWVGTELGPSTRRRFIARFSLSNHGSPFTRLPLPDEFSTFPSVRIVPFRQSIGLIACVERIEKTGFTQCVLKNVVYTEEKVFTEYTFELWATDANGVWVRFLVIHPLKDICVPLQVWRTSEVVTLRCDLNKKGFAMHFYNPEHRSPSMWFPNASGCSIDVLSHTESLLSIPRKDVVKRKGKCAEACKLEHILDPFLPWGNKAQQYKELVDAFGKNNLETILKNMREGDRAELVYSLLFEAELRTKDLVMGAYGKIVQLRSELEREEASLKDLGLEDITAEAMEKETLPVERVLTRDHHPCLTFRCNLECPFTKCVPHIDVNIASASEICQVYEHKNVVRLLRRVEEKDWPNLVNSLSFEVKARRDHPVTGCHGLVLELESKVKRVKSILKLQKELIVRERELQKWKTVNFQQLVEEEKMARRLEGIGKYTPAAAVRWGSKRIRSKSVRR